MNKWFCLFVLIIAVVACKNKKKKADPHATYFPVVTYLKGQVAQMDTSLATIIKIEKTDSVIDTTYIRREEFKKYAAEFLQIPDISSKKLKNDYEVTNMYDDLLDAFVFTYTTTEEDHSIRKQDVIVDPGEGDKSEIRAINIDQWESNADSTVQKNLLWEANKRFFIIKKISKPDQQEKVRILEVRWTYSPAAL